MTDTTTPDPQAMDNWFRTEAGRTPEPAAEADPTDLTVGTPIADQFDEEEMGLLRNFVDLGQRLGIEFPQAWHDIVATTTDPTEEVQP